MEDGTWNKAYCFVFITCTMGSVGGYRRVVNRQTGDPCLQGGGKCGWKPCRPGRRGGGDSGISLCISQRVMEERGKA
jgi:hypothetical protein